MSAAPQPLLHVGLHAHRLAPEENNPREVAFAAQWRRENSSEYRTHVLAELLVRRTGKNTVFSPFEGNVEQLAPYDQDAASVAATVMQWLGSKVGFCFLEEALAKCGYQIVSKR